jgi:hypothetical protein
VDRGLKLYQYRGQWLVPIRHAPLVEPVCLQLLAAPQRGRRPRQPHRDFGRFLAATDTRNAQFSLITDMPQDDDAIEPTARPSVRF